MELYNVICCQGCCRITIAEGLTMEEHIDMVALLNKSKPPRTHYLRSRTPQRRAIELITSGKVEVDW